MIQQRLTAPLARAIPYHMPLPNITSTWERPISPISTTSSSVVSIDSISSESSISLSRATQPRVISMNFLGDKESGVHHPNFGRHDKYFFKDGNITFLVRPSLIVCDSAHRSIQGRRHTLLRPPIFLFTAFNILRYQARPAWDS